MKKSILKSLLGLAGMALYAILIIVIAMDQKHDEFGGKHMVTLVIAAVFIFSFIVRKNSRFKPYFTSDFNLLTSKIKHSQSFDFSKEILVEKFQEVLQTAGYKIVDVNQQTGDIFAVTTISWYSWGENIYIRFTEDNHQTMVDFCSACLFQVYSWGKNERNYQHLMKEFEKSLTI